MCGCFFGRVCKNEHQKPLIIGYQKLVRIEYRRRNGDRKRRGKKGKGCVFARLRFAKSGSLQLKICVGG